MNKQICIIILMLTCRICDAQNLVPNSSFEDYNQCPDNWNQLYKVMDWTRYNTESPDYWNACDTSISASVPFNHAGYQQAATGNGYIGIVLSSGNGPNSYREYLGATLVSPLTIGTKYYISLKTSLTFGDTNVFKNACNSQCVLFTSTSYSSTNPLPTSLNFAQLRNMTIITDTLNWTTLRWSFIADSAYQYIVLGNFYADSLTGFLQVNTSPSAYSPFAYYYFDDICVSTDSITCNPPTGINEVMNQEELVLFPNPFSDKINITTKRNELLEVILYDVTSRKIFNLLFTNSTTINTSQLAKGIYLYEVRNKSGVIKKGKVVKD